MERITMGVQLSPELYQDLCKAADRAGVTKSVIVRWAITDYVEFILQGGEIWDGSEDRREAPTGDKHS